MHGNSSSSPNTMATSCSRHRSKKRSSRKLSWRGSMTWRSGIPSSSRGSSLRKAAMSSRSNLRRAASIHRIGPSLGPSALSPWARKLPMPSPASAIRGRVTQKREPLIANWKPSGTAAAQAAQLFGLLPAVEGRVDLDRAECARGKFELFGLRRAWADKKSRAMAERSSRRCRSGSRRCSWRRKSSRPKACKFAFNAGLGRGYCGRCRCSRTTPREPLRPG